MQINDAKLRQRFTYLWDRIGANGVTPLLTNEVFDQIWAAYHEPHRSYHDIRHVVEMLELFDATRAGVGIDDDPANVVELAIWYHDIVYYTQAPEAGVSNEELSGAWARTLLTAASARAYFPRVIYRLIASTRIGVEPSDALERFLHDLDYAIIGAADYDRFLEYEDGIRFEWQHVPAEVFAMHRTAFLRQLAESERIYRTDHFHEMLDSAARANLRRLVDTGEDA